MARYYVNRFGRFLSPDPLNGSATDPQSLNHYGYTENDPVNAADPSGLMMITPNPSWFLGFGGGGFGDDWNEFNVFAIPSGGPGSYWTDGFCVGCEPSLGMLSGQDYAGNLLAGIVPPSNPNPPPPPGYKKCITEALEAVLAAGEGTASAAGGGYGLVVYGTVMSAPASFSSLVGQTFGASNPLTIDNPEALNGNPRIYVAVTPNAPPSQWSSAFGRYQITNTTANYFGFTDFSPAGQDAAAAAMLNSYDAVGPAMQGNLQQALWNMWPWASMPDSPLPGNSMSFGAAQSIYNNAIATLPDCQ